ncbi:MAG: FMN-binding protein [Pirellulaceae bacterium]
MSRTTTPWRSLAPVVHAARVALVVALLLAIPSPVRSLPVDAETAPETSLIADVFGNDGILNPVADGSGLWSVNDSQGQPLAKVARTLPIAKDVVGYRGPTEALIVFDQELNVDRVRLLSSADTVEHVDAVVTHKKFFDQFRGWPWGGPEGKVKVDAVSGATLTSLALAEGVLKRIGGDRPSLVFPDEFTTVEKDKWLADAPPSDRLIRTGPLTDDIAGYQGPTELLFRIDQSDSVNRIRLRSSFDNEPYVDYVRMETGFWKTFEGKTIDELAVFDPVAQRVEGVSGATMTSLAVADTIVAVAKELREMHESPSEDAVKSFDLNVRWTLPDLATIGMLLLLAVVSRTGWFRKKWLRRIWLVAVTLVVGLWAGNLVSMALVAGWGAEGIAWRLAPGLAAIAIVAMFGPAISKGNPYCNHLCPHGAIQQLIRPSSKSRRRIYLSPKLQRLLHWIPGTMLVIAYVILIIHPSIDLSSWEPFHAYLFRISGWGSIALAIGSLALAAVIPMGYCRLGCPTGRLLDYLRLTSASHKIRLADLVSSGLLGAAMIARTM